MIAAAANQPPDAVAAKFLGPSAGRGGPFALLGLTHEASSPRVIREAAARRLNQIDRHPMRRTPEADELRLAVHAAAAQLADTVLHAELVRHWPPGEAEPVPVAWRSHLSAVSAQLADQARKIVGASGGWNPRAKKRLAHLARLHRVSAVDLLVAVRPAGANTAGKRAGAKKRLPPMIPEPGSTGAWWLRLHGGLAAMLVLMLTLIAIELSSSDDPGAASAIVDTTGIKTPAMGDRSGPMVPGPRTSIAHHAALEQELRNTLLMASDRPGDGAERGARAIDAFLDNWTQTPPDTRDRIADSLAEIIARVTVPGADAEPANTASPMTGSIAAAAASPDAVRSAGARALARWLGSSRALTRATRARVLDAAGLEEDPSSAATLTERIDPLMAQALTDAIGLIDPNDGEAWEAWSAALASAKGAGESVEVQTRLVALERLLNAGPGVAAGQGWADAVTSVATGLSWRAGDAARVWFLGALTSDRYASSALAGLTEVLATRVSAPGVDPGMVLTPGADAAAREALAGRYRSAWMNTAGVDPALREELIERIAGALGGAAAASGRGGDDRAAKAAALLGLARVNAAAAMLFGGDEAQSAELMSIPSDTPAPSSARTSPSGEGLSDAWARELLATENAGRVMAMLNEAAARRDPASPTAAEAIVVKAMQGGEGGVRDRAREVVLGSGWDIQMLLALERTAARRPSTALGEMITGVTGVTLPPPRDDDWLDRVRAALLSLVAERWAEARPAELVFADLTLAELTLAELAARRAGLSAGEPMLRSLAIETDAWAARNGLPLEDSLSASAIEARRAALTAGARAEIQSAAVQHRALVEMIAGAGVAAGSRARSSVDRTLGAMDAAWASARGVIDQLLASHRAEAELWRSLLEGS